MKSSFRRFAVRASLCAALASTPALFAAAPALDRLVAGDAALVVGLRDVPTLRARLPETSWGKAWADPEVARFFAPLLAHPKLAAFRAESLARAGAAPEELFELLTGDVLLTMPAPSFTEKGAPLMLLSIDVGQNQERVDALLQAEAAKLKGTLGREDHGAVALHLFTPEGVAEGDGAVAWAVHEGRVFVGSRREAVVSALDALAAGGLPNSLAESAGYTGLLARASGRAESVFMLNWQAVYPALLAALEAKRDPAAQPNMFGLEPVAVVKSLGLDAIQGISFVGSHADDTDRLDGVIAYSEPRGLVRLLAYHDGPVARPDWMPASWFNVSSQNFSLSDFYATIEDTLMGASPLLAALAQGQLQAFEKRLGAELKRDVLDAVGVSWVSGYAWPAGTEPGATGYEELDQFFAVSLIDAPAFERAVAAVRAAFFPEGGAFALSSREHLGATIHTITMPGAGRGFSYAISEGWLLCGIGSAGTVESVLQLQREPKAESSFWRRPEVVAATAGAPERAFSVQYTELPPLLAAVARSLVNAQGEEGFGGKDILFDAAAVPGVEVFARYFKHVVGHGVRTDEGLVFRSEGPAR